MSGTTPALGRRVIPSFLFSRSAEELVGRDHLGGWICNFDEFWVYKIYTQRENPVDEVGFLGPAQTLLDPGISVPGEQRSAVRKQPRGCRWHRCCHMWRQALTRTRLANALSRFFCVSETLKFFLLHADNLIVSSKMRARCDAEVQSQRPLPKVTGYRTEKGAL